MYGDFGSARGSVLLAVVVSTGTTTLRSRPYSSVLVVRKEVTYEDIYTLAVVPNGMSRETDNECE